MKGHIKIGWFIIISTIIILFIFQLFTLKEVYEHEKSLLSHTIEDVLKADISHLNVLCIKKGVSKRKDKGYLRRGDLLLRVRIL